MARSEIPGTSTRKRVPRMVRSRMRIIEVARDLMAENQANGFSMRELAKQAGVSVMTIYNLIGEKDAVILGVLESGLLAQPKYVEPAGESDPFTLIMDVAFRSVDALFDREDLFRPAFERLLSPSGFALTGFLRSHRQSHWVAHLDRAVAAELLVPTINAAEVSKVFDDVMRSTVVPWLWGILDRTQFVAVVSRRLLNVLAGFATEAGKARLQPMLAELEATRSHRAKARRRRSVTGSQSNAS